MDHTTKLSLSQVLDLMESTMRMQGRVVTENLDAIPEAQRWELCRLGSAMWQEVLSLRTGIQMVTVQADPAFQSFKTGLPAQVPQPKKCRRQSKGAAA